MSQAHLNLYFTPYQKTIFIWTYFLLWRKNRKHMSMLPTNSYPPIQYNFRTYLKEYLKSNELMACLIPGKIDIPKLPPPKLFRHFKILSALRNKDLKASSTGFETKSKFTWTWPVQWNFRQNGQHWVFGPFCSYPSLVAFGPGIFHSIIWKWIAIRGVFVKYL